MCRTGVQAKNGKSAPGHFDSEHPAIDVHVSNLITSSRGIPSDELFFNLLHLSSASGTCMEGLYSTLGVSEEAKQVSPDRLVRLYQERMSVVESECVQDLTELFLENIELFKTDPEWDVLLRVQQQLKVSSISLCVCVCVCIALNLDSS